MEVLGKEFSSWERRATLLNQRGQKFKVLQVFSLSIVLCALGPKCVSAYALLDQDKSQNRLHTLSGRGYLGMGGGRCLPLLQNVKSEYL